MNPASKTQPDLHSKKSQTYITSMRTAATIAAVLLFYSWRLMCLMRTNGVLVPCRYPCALSPVNYPATYPRACFPCSGAAIATFPVPVSGPSVYTARLFIQAAFIASNKGERNALSELRFAKHTTAPCG